MADRQDRRLRARLRYARLRHNAAVEDVDYRTSAFRSTREVSANIAPSLDIQTRLWQQATAITAEAPQLLPTHRFVVSLNEMNNIHERRLTALRYRVAGAVTFTLIGVAMMAKGIAGYHAGMTESQRHMATQIMSLTVAVVIMLIADFDRPARGLIQEPVQALLDAEQGIPSGR